MIKHRYESESFIKLRWRAEEKAQNSMCKSVSNVEEMSVEQVRLVFHELCVNKIELKMQNEELRRVQVELEAARARYFELYNLAPVGYCIVSMEGLILEANLAAVTLLSVASASLIKQPITRFIYSEPSLFTFK